VIAAFRLEGAEEESSEAARMRLSRRDAPTSSLPSQRQDEAQAEAPSRPALNRPETAPAEEEWETF
jgi:methyl-accepting chemotaxis protein/aerotaxis receptor